MNEMQEKLLNLLKNPTKELEEQLNDYHESDIALSIVQLTRDERLKLYEYIDNDKLGEIFSYLDDPSDYLLEIEEKRAISIINEMDVDDVIDILEDFDEDERDALIEKLDEENKQDIKLIDSYNDDEIGSKMTTNYNTVKVHQTIKECMKSVVNGAAENDNINIIYCVNDDNTYFGAINLRDLIIARSDTPLEDIIKTNYPTLQDHDKVSDILEKIKSYTLEYLPVLNNHHNIIGIITHDDIIEAVDEEMSEDYSKLAGLTDSTQPDEPIRKSILKRIPWLIILLLLDFLVSSLVSGYEHLIGVFPLIATFQTLLLDMSGNSGTQSLGVTILAINDNELTFKRIFKMVTRELLIGLSNGVICGVIVLGLVGVFITIFKQDSIVINGNQINPFIISGVIGFTLFIGITIASIVGCIVPIIFKKIHVDPATASGPFISTINDIVTLVLYFSFVLLFFKEILHIM